MNPPLIDQPEAVSRSRRTIAGVITLLGWLAYAWLWVPVLTLVAWAVGIRTAWQRLYLEHNAVDPFILASLPVIAIVCGLLLIGWAEYNRARFTDADERKRRKDVDEDAVSERLGAPLQVSEALRAHRVVTVTLNDDALPVAVRPGTG